ncbi:MAG: class I SAM-dependent methyltransferase [Candidatus Woesearchaeota archaeon]
MVSMWTKKQSSTFKTPNYSKEYLRKPEILKLLGNLKGKKLLEIGSGSGYWTRFFAKKGATCYGVELEKNQIKISIDEELRKPLGIKYYNRNATNLKCFKNNSFDIVFLEYVLIEISKLSDVQRIFNESFRVLKKGGKIYISDMHPFDPLCHPQNFEYEKKFNYFSSGEKIYTKALQLDGKFIKFKDYHWTLEDYFNTLTNAGFLISTFKEPRPSIQLIKKIPYLAYRKNLVKDVMIVGNKF